MKVLRLILFSCLLSLASYAQEAPEDYVPNQYIVQLRGETSPGYLHKLFPLLLPIECLSKSMNIWLLEGKGADLLPQLSDQPLVIAAQHNHIVKRRGLIPNDSRFGNQWNMLNISSPSADIHATQAWQINHSNVTRLGDTIVVAVVDFDFDIQHEDINFFVNRNEIPGNGIDDDRNGYIDDYHGWNTEKNNDSVSLDFENHGTHCAGIVGAIGNNSNGVAGVCWGVKIMPISTNGDSETAVIKAYDYVIEMRKLYDLTSGAKGAYIVATSNSFGVDRKFPSYAPIWCAMYDSMGRYGILSAGAPINSAIDIDQQGDIPGTCPSRWLLAVTNTTNQDKLSYAGPYGSLNVDLAAPGTNITSCYLHSGYGGMSGTSMSTPHVAGAIAALYANACDQFIRDYDAHPDSMALAIRQYLLQSVDVLPTLAGKTGSGGRLNLLRALLAQESYTCGCHYSVELQGRPSGCTNDSSGAVSVIANTQITSIRWNTGDSTRSLSHLAEGLYQATITDTSGCQRTLHYYQDRPLAISVTGITIIPIAQGSTGNIIIDANSANDSLFYAIDSGSYQSSKILITTTAGAHHLRIKNQHGCLLDTTVYIYQTGISNQSDDTYLSLFPNPNTGAATLRFKSATVEKAMLTITDLAGRELWQESIPTTATITEKAIDTSLLYTGIYLLSITHNHERLKTIKMIVQ